MAKLRLGMVNCVRVVHSEMLAEPQASPKRLHESFKLSVTFPDQMRTHGFRREKNMTQPRTYNYS